MLDTIMAKTDAPRSIKKIANTLSKSPVAAMSPYPTVHRVAIK